MFERLRNAVCIFASVSLAAVSLCLADDSALTPMEIKWLDAADPVLQYAAAQGLPIDVVVRPVSRGEAPFSVGVENNRCKLVLVMRDRADAEETLAGVSESQQSILIEAMTAHEVAHCWRYIHGQWNALPAGVQDPLSFANNDTLTKQRRAMRTVQYEEAYADLVALAWTQLKHPTEYGRVYAWLKHVRDDQPVEGSFHDTRPWIALASDPKAFMQASTPFEQVQGLWVDGLKSTAAP